VHGASLIVDAVPDPSRARDLVLPLVEEPPTDGASREVADAKRE
jgi:hypothetical protein